VSGQSDIIIDYATTRRCEEPISTAITESTVHWLLHRRMNAQQQMRWSPRGAHLMLKVRTAVVNGTLDRDHVVAERWARRPFRRETIDRNCEPSAFETPDRRANIPSNKATLKTNAQSKSRVIWPSRKAAKSNSTPRNYLPACNRTAASPSN
jgi:hypothetical protein